MEEEKKLSYYIGKKLLLTQPKFFKQEYLLKFGEEIIATIINPKWYRSDFEVLWNNKKWVIYRPSIWRSAIEIKELDKELPIASYQKIRFKSDGIVNLPMGQQLKISFKLFKGSYEIQNIYGECLVTVKDKLSWKDETEFHIQSKSELLDKYPWVILLAWYLSSQRKHSAAIAAT